MKFKLILPLVILGLSLFLYSCESNDAPVTYTSISAGSTNKVLVELFTNTSCVPCVQANTYLDGINDTNVIIIRWHTTLYPNDPYYLYNPTDNNARQTYYGAANANPKAFLLGNFMGNYSAGGSNWTASLNTQLGAVRPMGIAISKSYDTLTRAGNMNIAVSQNSGTAIGDLVVHIALTENGLLYNAPNGEDIFEQVLRDLLTSPDGDVLNIAPGQTLTFPKSFTIPNDINDKNASIIVFTQSVSSKQIYGVETVKLR